MKLLGWMHRKLMQKNTTHQSMEINYTTFGNHPTCFSIQTSSSDQQNYYIDGPPKTTSTHSNIKYEGFPDTFEASCKVEKVPYQHQEDEPFEFLSIGTFGMDPPTPTLPMSTDDQQPIIEITENDLSLMIINYELEKFLEKSHEETSEEICNDDSSQRSMSRSRSSSSQASIITTLTDHQGHVQIVACPLQIYLVELAEEQADDDKEVKKTRTSLEELFKKKMNNIIIDGDDDDDPPIKELGEEHEEGRKGNVADHFIMKKKKKKVVKMFNPTSSSYTAAAAIFKPIKKKLSKTIVKMVQKKVYPEEKMTTKKKHLFKGHYKNKKHISCSEDDHHHHHIGSKKSKKLFWTRICKGGATSSPVNSNTGGGHWIKTDSDYLVLEL